MKKFTKKDFLVFGGCIILVIFAMIYNQQIQAQNQVYFPRPLSDDDIKKYSNHDNAVVIYPIFTQIAYQEPKGFYDYFNKTCSDCNVISMKPFGVNASYTSSVNGISFLQQLHYPIITDKDVDQNPDILNQYDKIILLHNEYMTQKEFDAIKNHKNIIYLYPNAMYAKISVDYNNWSMTLVRGHSYPDKSILNGFDYSTSSKHEYDLNCKNYKWESMPNGIQLDCWPEFLIKADRNLLETIKDYPQKSPELVTPIQSVNMSGLPKCDYFGHCT